MPHLTPQQLDYFRERLLAAKDSARAVLEQSKAGVKPVEAAGETIGRLTRMDAIAMQAMEQKNRYQLEIQLQQIEASLQSFEAGTFGRCRSCKGPVGIERLEVLPEAPFCVACQEGFET